MKKMAKAVHEKCTELFKKLANYEAKEEKEKQVIELAKRKLKTESDAKLKEMELIFPLMVISDWIIHSDYEIGFKLDGIWVKTADMTTFSVNQSPPQYLDEDNTKLLVNMYNKVLEEI